jgi:hypothetical protein
MQQSHSKSLKSEGHRSSMRDLWNLLAPHCEPFRRMIAHPALIQRLNWMMGSGYGVTQCNAFLSEKGGSGLFRHSGSWDPRAANHYEVRNGRAYCEWVNVVWQLRDVTPEDGGFAVVPGTHKGRYPTPEALPPSTTIQWAWSSTFRCRPGTCSSSWLQRRHMGRSPGRARCPAAESS